MSLILPNHKTPPENRIEKGGQVQAVFPTVGYPDRVADLLAALCSHSTPGMIWDQLESPPHGQPLHKLQEMYSRPHLPQGAPTSPSLANLCAYRLDCRLWSLAQSVGARYTRYADDIAFSGGVEFHRMVKRFCLHVCTVMMEQGFSVHYRKTRIMRQATRQQLAGIVLNDCLNVRRLDYDRLKATLNNCLQHGAASQNRAGHEDYRAHLLGRISYVTMVNRNRGDRLRQLFERIKWD